MARSSGRRRSALKETAGTGACPKYVTFLTSSKELRDRNLCPGWRAVTGGVLPCSTLRPEVMARQLRRGGPGLELRPRPHEPCGARDSAELRPPLLQLRLAWSGRGCGHVGNWERAARLEHDQGRIHLGRSPRWTGLGVPGSLPRIPGFCDDEHYYYCYYITRQDTF